DELPAEYKAELMRSSACGDILAHFFGVDGALFEAEHSYQLLAFDIAALRSMKRSICLAGGRAKGLGIAVAARAGFFSDLITDEITAIDVLEIERRARGIPKASNNRKTPTGGAEAQ
ncbi:MAG: sugar-binding domain-containing protein, partial [Rectinemataceae bacterium]|nr:sugar-binding domain-containing protein [Rectinemataceae bacterium]